MIDLQELIRESQQILSELQNGTYQIITRASPITWEDLRSYLETNLVPILKRLYDKIGGLMEQPHVVLPDGVTSTSLVTQSEMTQFVTDTLNTWFGNLNERIEEILKQTIYALRPAITTFKLVPRIVNFNVPSATVMATTLPSVHYDTKGFKTKKINIGSTFIEPAKPKFVIFKEE